MTVVAKWGHSASSRAAKKHKVPIFRQSGIALVAVLVFLLVIAALAALKGGEEIGEVKLAVTDAELRQVGYVAQAGMQRAVWLAERSACSGDFTVPVTPLDADNYTATATGAGTTTSFVLPVDQDAWVRSDNPSNNQGTNADLHTRFESGNVEQPLVRFDLSALPPGAQINSASVWFYVEGNKQHPEGPITIHRITADWTESGVTWDSLNGRYDSAPLAMIPAQPDGDVWVQVNLTAQVQAWVNGAPNHGILLNSVAEGVHAEYVSREGAANQHPRLEVTVGTGATANLQIQATGTLSSGMAHDVYQADASAYQSPSGFEITTGAGAGQDTFIKQDQEYDNFGAHSEMWVQDTAGGNGDNSLLQFDLTGLPSNAQILNATLSLYQFYTSTPGGTVGVHRLTRDWEEGNNTGGIGNSSWRTYGFFRWWSNPGGDYEADGSAEAVIPSGGAGVDRHEWEITSLVNGWISGAYPNQGVILIPAAPGTEVAFATSDDADSTLHPKLRVTYACACGTACLAPQGWGNVLMVVGTSVWSLGPGDTAVRDLLQSWGYTVNLIQDDDSQGNFDSAVAANDVVFISESVTASNIGTKLTNAPIGVISAKGELNAQLGVAAGSNPVAGTTMDLIDTGHYITQIFPAGALSFKSAASEMQNVNGAVAPGAQALTQIGGAGSIVVVDTGAALIGGGVAAGRRALVPVGEADFDLFLSNNGQLIFQRALQWGTGDLGPGLGDAIILSTDSAATLGGLTFDDIDLAEYDAGSDSATLFFEGALTTLTIDIDALHVIANGHILLSTKDAATLGGLSFADGDLVEYDPATDTATLFFDESLFSADEDIVSVYLMDNGHLLLSTDSAAILGGLSFTDKDLAEYDPASDTATLYFDGSTTTLASDIDAVHLLPNGHIVLSTKDNASLGGLSFADGDLVDYDPATDSAVPYFGEGLFSANEDVISAHIGPGSGSVAGGGGTLPIAHWKLDDGVGPTATDSEGGNDGTLTNGPAWDTGIIDGGLRFDGGNDYVDAGTFDVSGSGLTMMGWFNADTIGTNDPRIISKANSTAVSGAWWQLSSSHAGANRYLRMRIKAGGATTSFADSSVNLSPGQWYFAAATYDAGSGAMKLYLDGSEIASGFHSVGGPVDAGPTVPVWIGANGTADRFLDGVLDDVRVYDKALSPSEITDIYAAGGGGGGGSGTTVEITVAAGSDDAEQLISDGTMLVDSTDLELADNLAATAQPTDIAGIRFANVTVPQGQTITKAYIQFQVDELDSGAAALTVEGDATDDANSFTTSPFNITSRPRTSISIPWAPPVWTTTGERGPEQRTGNIAPVIQEIVDRPGWASGNALAVIIGGSGVRTAEALEGDPAAAPMLHIEYGGIGYIETYQEWTASQADTWQLVDLGSFGVPPGAVVEVAVTNLNTGAQRWAGVRAVGSSLQRRFQLHEPEGGGDDVVVMHVQADGSAQIEHYADTTADIKFAVMGYWTGGTYIERFDSFTAGASGAWRDRDLAPFGVGPGQVVEIVMTNTSTSAERMAGVRNAGSSLDRRVDIHEAESGGVDAATMLVNVDSSPNATIQVNAESDSNIGFYLVGYWASPPGTFTEAAVTPFNPSSPSSAWTGADLSGDGVPADSVVQMAVMNGNTSQQANLGVREVGSGRQRWLRLQEAESGGRDVAVWHVNANDVSSIQWYDENAGATHEFQILGWWE